MYRHGIFISERPTSITPPEKSTAGIPVVIGTAPVNLADSGYKVNEPVLCSTYDEAVNALGFSNDYANYTLCEFIKSHFELFKMAPAVLINILDPAVHKTEITDEQASIIGDIGILNSTGILKETVVIKSDDGATIYQKDIDYILAFNDEGKLVLTRKKDGTIPQNTTSLKVSYTKLDPSKVTTNDIIGGIDATTGKYKGLELLNQVFPRFTQVPGSLLAPYWSSKPEVAAVMDVKAENINGHFKCAALIDVPTDTVKNYTDVSEWKTSNNITGKNQFLCWPMLKYENEIFHMSTQLAGVICKTDFENDNVPYVSPSNHNFVADAAVLKDGTEVYLGPDQAAYLNGEGIVTALNFIGGIKAWGNRTAQYSAALELERIIDPKDVFIPVRRMFNWIGNTLTLKFWKKLDYPLSKRLIETIVDSANIWLNGLSARGFILGGRLVFLQEENPVNDIMDGKVRFHLYVTPPSPAREIDFIVEYDAKYIQGIFS